MLTQGILTKKHTGFEAKNPTGSLSIFRIQACRKRVFLSCLIQYVANATGALVISYCSAIICTILGLTGYLQLLMYSVYMPIEALDRLFSMLTIERTGRRFVCRRFFPA